jgi:hypothetical protein
MSVVTTGIPPDEGLGAAAALAEGFDGCATGDGGCVVCCRVFPPLVPHAAAADAIMTAVMPLIQNRDCPHGRALARLRAAR